MCTVASKQIILSSARIYIPAFVAFQAFLINACRGVLEDIRAMPEFDGQPITNNCMLWYSTVQDYVSWVLQAEGSMFIKRVSQVGKTGLL